MVMVSVLRKRLGAPRRWTALMTSIPCLLAILCHPAGAPAAAGPVYVFPSPNTLFATPQTQITFRGVSVSQLGHITVSGSSSGAHAGKVLSDSDNGGGSFVPDRSFTPGEYVTVSTGVNIAGGSSGSFRFRVASPAPPNHAAPFPATGRVRGDITRFRSRPDLAPASVRIVRQSRRTARGDIFVAPEVGPLQDGPMILDWRGNIIWFKPLSGRRFATDFRVQRYQGRPVLTWWQGGISVGIGSGQGVIYDTSYRQLAVVNAGNGLSADLHEFQLTPRGTALITAYYPVYHDATSVHGSRRQIVEDSVVQEIDIPTGLVLFEWHSLDHVPLLGSHGPVKIPYNYFHVNSVDEDTDGNLLISGRNTWSVYKVDRHTGATIWVLGGRFSSFAMGPGAQFSYQHDVRVRARGDRLITVFDDGGSPFVHNSRGITLRLDFRHKRATRLGELDHSPPLQAQFEGNVQTLPNGDQFVGWGQPPYFSEFNSRGQMIFDARFVDDNSSYRSWRMRWSATPPATPRPCGRAGMARPASLRGWCGEDPLRAP
jgi:hypothetical protein